MAKDLAAIRLHKDVLDAMVTANGLFTAAVFLGVTGTVTPLSTVPTQCVAGDDINRMFFLFEIGSFGCYLLSSLIAQGLKMDIVYYENTRQPDDRVKEEVPFLRPFMFISVGFSLLASFLLLLSIIELVQIKLGLYSCGEPSVVISAIVNTMVILSGIALYTKYSYGFLVNVIKHFGKNSLLPH